MWIIKLMEWKSTSPPSPNVKCCLGFYSLVVHFVFEWILFGVIMVNIICTIVELTIDDTTGLTVLRYFNYVFCLIYIAEATLKMIGLRQYYFLSKWNIFDFLILLVAIVDIIVELSLPEGAADTRFSPSVIRIVRVLRILRVGRVLRLIKVSFLSLSLSLSLSLWPLTVFFLSPMSLSTVFNFIFFLSLACPSSTDSCGRHHHQPSASLWL